MLKAGSRAPDFEAVQHDGGTFRLSEHFGRQPVVLYFHTGAFSIL